MSSMTSTSFGLENVLKVNYKSDFVLFSVESEISFVRLAIIQQLLVESEVEDQQPVFHVVNFANEFLPNLTRRQNVIQYDYLRGRFPGLDDFNEILNSKLIPDKKNILIIDDLTLLFLYCSRVLLPVKRFLRRLSSSHGVKIIGFYDKATQTIRDSTMLLNEADTFCDLVSDSDGGTSLAFNSIVIRANIGAKKHTEKESFEIFDGIIRKKDLTRSTSKIDKDDIFKSLTTFKLTLEENERETKNHLYLPYFEAQRIPISNPNQSDDFEDDLDDDSEEV